MADAARGLARRYGVAFWLAGGWALAAALAILDRHVSVHWELHEFVPNVIVRVLSGFPSLTVAAVNGYDALMGIATGTYVVSLFLGTVFAPLGFLARMVARARLRAGHADPLQGLRRAKTSMQIVLALPALATQWLLVARLLHRGQPWDWHARFGVGVMAVAALATAAQWWLTRAAWRALLAPTMEGAHPAAEIGDDEIRFDAIAVTRETRAAVVGLGAVTLAMTAWLCVLPIQALYYDRRVFWAIGAYVLSAAVGAATFRRASRIAVGLDGVQVGGTSRSRFFAYRDLDEAREHGGDLELVRRGRVLLRLQLHGEDAGRREAILQRIRAGIARVAHVARDGAANFVAAAPKHSVARSTQEGADYRMPTVSRDALWALVEGAGVDATARTAAAEAISQDAADGDRERLRVAASRVAEPRVRVVLEEFATEENDADIVGGAKRATSLP